MHVTCLDPACALAQRISRMTHPHVWRNVTHPHALHDSRVMICIDLTCLYSHVNMRKEGEVDVARDFSLNHQFKTRMCNALSMHTWDIVHICEHWQYLPDFDRFLSLSQSRVQTHSLPLLHALWHCAFVHIHISDDDQRRQTPWFQWRAWVSWYLHVYVHKHMYIYVLILPWHTHTRVRAREHTRANTKRTHKTHTHSHRHANAHMIACRMTKHDELQLREFTNICIYIGFQNMMKSQLRQYTNRKIVDALNRSEEAGASEQVYAYLCHIYVCIHMHVCKFPWIALWWDFVLRESNPKLLAVTSIPFPLHLI